MIFEERAEFLRQSIAARDLQLAELKRSLAKLADPTETRAMLNDYIAESREATREMNLAVTRLETAMRRLDGRA